MKISGFPNITPVTRVDWTTRRRYRSYLPFVVITRRRRFRSHWWR